MSTTQPTYDDLLKENEQLRYELDEATDTIEAIRTGQVDALVVDMGDAPKIYTLTTADQTYRLFIETMTEGAVTVNRDGLVFYSNSQFARILGLNISEILGADFKDFVAGTDQDNFAELFLSGWEHGARGELLLNNESKTYVQLSLTKLVLSEGEFLSIIISDLTELKEKEQQLENKNRQLERINTALEISNNDLMQFASVASHDLQEPLRKIIVFLQLFTETNTEELSPKAKGFLEKIRYSSEKMKQLIIDILNYSRLSAKDNVYVEVDLDTLVKEVLQDYELLIQEKQAVVSISGMPHITANKGQITQVFQNIISNALKFSKPGIPVALTISSAFVNSPDFNAPPQPDGAYCRISVKDNGIGFDEQYIQNVFSLFERLNAKDKYEGSGIGMSIAKKIVEKHHGRITAYSSEGHGTEFIIILPVKQ